jgi:hypothetical protein
LRLEISLALDADKPGQDAVAKSGEFLMELMGSWGTPRYPGEPISIARAAAEQAYDTAQTDDERSLIWDYIETLYHQDKETAYSKALTADEFIGLLAIEENPILPTHGRIDFEAIKNKVDIVDYISKHVELRQRGNKWLGKCPFPDHQDSTPSFWVYPESRSFYCFGCLKGGDVIEYAKLRGIRARDMT